MPSSSPLYTIYSTQRSGSTLLIHLLDQHPDLICAGEIFKVKKSASILHPELSFNFPEKKKTIAYKWTPAYSLKKHLKSLISTSPVGFKLMVSQLEAIPKLEQVVKKNVGQIFVLRRKNVVKQSLSLEVARASGKWINAGKDKSSSLTIKLEDFTRTLNYNERCDKRLRDFATSNSCTEYFYEDLAASTLETAQNVFSKLGVDKTFKPEIRVRKSSERTYAERIANYPELIAFLEKRGYQDLPL